MLCSARVHHCLLSLVRVVDWCVSRLVRLTYCRIILTASSQGKLLIYLSLVIHLLVLPPLDLPKGPLSSSVANYRPISITSVLSKVFERLVSVSLGRFMSFQPASLLIGKVWVPVMHFCVCPIHCRVHWRVGRRLRLCRFISVQLLIG